jgi:uncharacterized protein YdeI (YjbR/CyaY-like superfamily)
MQKVKSAADFISKHPEWRNLLTTLRQITRESELDETIKWGVPVYTFNGKNVVSLTAFKQHVALWFFQGALLEDQACKLVNAQEGKTKAQRQWRFRIKSEIDKKLILNYISEAIDNQRKGLAVKAALKKPFTLPSELKEAFTQDSDLKPAFEGLATYKQREYAEYISGAKRADTKNRRLDKSIPLILEGKGLNDSYRQ